MGFPVTLHTSQPWGGQGGVGCDNKLTCGPTHMYGLLQRAGVGLVETVRRGFVRQPLHVND